MVKTAGRFRRGLLPPAKTFFEHEIGRLTRPTAKGWALGRCPFHPSKSGKSLSVNIRTGAWCCFGCGAKGDLISFVRKRYSLSFRDAAIYLKAIDTDTTPAHVETLKAADLERQREREAEQEKLEKERGRRLQARMWLHAVEKLSRRTSDHLSKLRRQEDPEKPSAEAETAWELLALLHTERAEAELTYCELAGLEFDKP